MPNLGPEPHTRAESLWRRRALVSLGLIALSGGAVYAVWRSLAPRSRTTVTAAAGARAAPAADWRSPPNDGFVGSRACQECHAEIAEAYSSHPMSRSISPAAPDSEQIEVRWQAGELPGRQRTLWVELRDGGLWHHERMRDSAGQEIYDQAVKMDYAVGSGRRARAFLFRRGEFLYMSPLNWYTQARGWDLAPGYLPDDPRRFDRRVTDECLSCHAGRVAGVGRSSQKHAGQAFDEMAIGCENCHGPGREHVALRRSERAEERGADTIVNPARLDPERRESVCNQCHLQAAARVPRYGRSDLDFRPGNRFDEIWTALDHGSGISSDGRTRAVSHVQQMRESRCYAASDGRLGCTSCHDPHRVPPAGERAAFYRAKCLACHEDGACRAPREKRQRQDDSCIACHMPARAATNVSHVTQTDHRVIRAPTAGPVAKPAGGDALSFFDRADLRLEEWERDRALGLGAWKVLSKTARPQAQELLRLLQSVLERVPEDGAVLIAIGSLAAENGLADLARESFERARRLREFEEPAVSGLLDVYYLASKLEQALECADRLVKIDPADARAQSLRADILASLGRRSEGIAAARRALELNPTLLLVRQWLAGALREAGKMDESREEEQIIRRMQGARP